jgi:hypothetical protein
MTATASAADMVKAVGAGAAQTVAGVSGFMAPIIGPGAPAAGIAAGAAVESAALSLASFDVGSWFVPRDMPAMVHRGEMIVPSYNGLADQFRNRLSGGGLAGGSGGGDTHYHTHNNSFAINGARSPQDTAREVMRYLDRNLSSRGRY